MLTNLGIKNSIEFLGILVLNILVFILLPFNIKLYYLIVPFFCILSVWFYFRKKYIFSLAIIIALICCIPSFRIKEASDEMSSRSLQLIYATLISFIFIDRQRRRIKIRLDLKKYLVLFLIIWIINLVYYAAGINLDPLTLRSLPFTFIALIIPFYFSLNSNLNYSDFIKCLTVTFIGVLFFTLLNTFFRIQVYTPMYGDGGVGDLDLYGDLSTSIRPSALFGHPLVLSAVASFFFAFSIANYFLYRKVAVWGIVLSLVVTILSVSRTPFIIFIILFFIFLMKSKVLRERKSIFYLLLFLGSGFFLGAFVLEGFIESTLDRFQHDTDQVHRINGYITGWNVFSNNFFGLGEADLMKKIRVGHYNAPGFWSTFPTMDSFYMTLLSSYGILSILFYYFYLYYYFLAYHLRKKNKYAYNAILLIFITYGLIGFSFDIQYFPMLLAVVSLSCGFIFKFFQNNRVSYTSKSLSETNLKF